jgi:magnesium transporter
LRSLILSDGTTQSASPENLRQLLESTPSRGFWLDLENPDVDDFGILANAFRFHPLTIEDIQHQNQRPKLDEYPGYNFVVLFVAEWQGDTLHFREHHLYVSPAFLVTVHREPAPELGDLRQRLTTTPALSHDSIQFLTYFVVDVIVDVMFAVLDVLDDRIDRLEDDVVERAIPTDLAKITDLKHDVTELRRILGAQRDLFQRLITHTINTGNQEIIVYYRDVYDHLIRQYESVDSLRDLLSSAMDVYLSVVSNRLNATVKQLTVVASLFLPLSFLTGFFGMNFAVLVANLTTPTAFAAAVALMIFSMVGQLYFFRLRGWI